MLQPLEVEKWPYDLFKWFISHLSLKIIRALNDYGLWSVEFRWNSRANHCEHKIVFADQPQTVVSGASVFIPVKLRFVGRLRFNKFNIKANHFFHGGWTPHESLGRKTFCLLIKNLWGSLHITGMLGLMKVAVQTRIFSSFYVLFW